MTLIVPYTKWNKSVRFFRQRPLSSLSTSEFTFATSSALGSSARAFLWFAAKQLSKSCDVRKYFLPSLSLFGTLTWIRESSGETLTTSAWIGGASANFVWI